MTFIDFVSWYLHLHCEVQKYVLIGRHSEQQAASRHREERRRVRAIVRAKGWIR